MRPSPLALIVFVWTTRALAETAAAPEASVKLRQNVWGVGLQSRLLHWGEDENDRLHFMSQTLDVNRVWVHEQWWASIDLSLILGPVSKRLPTSPPIDYNGSGVGARFAYSLFSDGLRQPGGDWGIFLGAESMEITGHSYRRRVLEGGGVSEGWFVRSRWIAAIPGVFYSRLKPGRPKGNRPEWLMTRIEGYTVQVGLALPIKAELMISQTLNGVREKRRSNVHGYAALLSLSVWLGI